MNSISIDRSSGHVSVPSNGMSTRLEAIIMRRDVPSATWWSIVFSLCSVLILPSCSGLKKKQEPDPTAAALNNKKLTPDEAKEVLGEVGENWFYGHGFGKTLLNVGAFIIFPPYGLYVLGNGLLSAAGYEGYYVSDALPEKEREQYDKVYDNVTSVPGRVSSVLSGEEFRTPDVIKERMSRYSKPNSTSTNEATGDRTSDHIVERERSGETTIDGEDYNSEARSVHGSKANQSHYDARSRSDERRSPVDESSRQSELSARGSYRTPPRPSAPRIPPAPRIVEEDF